MPYFSFLRSLFLGCPKNPETLEDCSNHGDCDSVTHKCECNAAWSGVACHIPWCPGNGNCFDRGFCNPDYFEPVCENCQQGWMGPDCNTPCVNGVQVSAFAIYQVMIDSCRYKRPQMLGVRTLTMHNKVSINTSVY